MKAMTRISPPHEGHTSGSTSHIRLISCAHLRLRARASRISSRSARDDTPALTPPPARTQGDESSRLNGSCGAGSVVSGTTTVSLTGGNLPTGSSCTFQVTVQIPAATPLNVHANLTSEVTASVDGETMSGPPAGAVVVSFQIDNQTASAVSGLGLHRDVPAALMGMRTALQDALAGVFAADGITLAGEYVSVMCGGDGFCTPSALDKDHYEVFAGQDEALTEPCAGDGDLDGDRTSNADE